MQNVFYTTVEAVKSKIKKKYSKKEGGRLFTSKSIAAKVLTFMAAPLPFYFGNIVSTSQQSLYMDDAIFGGLFWCGVLLALFIVMDQVNARRKSMKTASKVFVSFVLWILFIGFFAISTAITGKSGGSYLLAFTSSGATFVAALFAMFMEKRTPETNKLQEKILGLRMFLVNAEQDRINTLVDENPDYFFNVLSYAYVLGVTDKWAKQFENVMMKKPGWYESSHMNTHFMPSAFTRSFTNSVNSMRSTMSSRPSSSSSGSGGYSGGGGGFSGGGGGGGGGGSW